MDSNRPVKSQILEVVQGIMINDGPDRHTDGSEVITSYICSIIKGEDEEWKRKYNERKSEEYILDKRYAAKDGEEFLGHEPVHL